MRKTLLLCFIHGFKGDDNTFANFPTALSNLLQQALPTLRLLSVVYPKYETRGELPECVAQFREWLQNKVIDLEVEAGTPSPTVDPSVHVILIGHSMGGIVAAETLLAICGEKTVPKSTEEAEEPALMFPYIHGILALDTPYLGIAPGVFAHGVEGNYIAANSALAQASALYTTIWGSSTSSKTPASKSDKKAPSINPKNDKVSSAEVLALPPPPKAPEAAAPGKVATSSSEDAAAQPYWQKWGKVAMFAGAAGAIAAGGAAAYMNREQLADGWKWAGSHLEFVGCLMKGEELKKRVNDVITINQELGVGFTNMYLVLGEEARKQSAKMRAGKLLGLDEDRTFCNLPKSKVRNFFKPTVNDKATQETWAHMNMFWPKENPGYYQMCESARSLVVEWTEAWSKTSTMAEEGSEVKKPSTEQDHTEGNVWAS